MKSKISFIIFLCMIFSFVFFIDKGETRSRESLIEEKQKILAEMKDLEKRMESVQGAAKRELEERFKKLDKRLIVIRDSLKIGSPPVKTDGGGPHPIIIAAIIGAIASIIVAIINKMRKS